MRKSIILASVALTVAVAGCKGKQEEAAAPAAADSAATMAAVPAEIVTAPNDPANACAEVTSANWAAGVAANALTVSGDVMVNASDWAIRLKEVGRTPTAPYTLMVEINAKKLNANAAAATKAGKATFKLDNPGQIGKVIVDCNGKEVASLVIAAAQ